MPPLPPPPRLTLYNYWRSSSSHRVRIALALKGLAYEYAAVDLARGEHGYDAHKARSPTGYVPCLVIDGVVYVESVAIVELLEERFPEPPLYPKGAHDRARVRALVEIVNSGTQPMHNRSVALHLARVAGDAATAPWTRHFIDRGLSALDRAVEANEREGVRGPFAYGERPTAADVFLVPQVLAAQRFHVPLDPYPRVRSIFDAATKLEAFRKAAPEMQVDAQV